MDTIQSLTLTEIESQVCDITAQQLAIPRTEVSPVSRLIDDLHCDSLDLLELVMALEDRFGVAINDHGSNPICKAIFTRTDFCLSDLAEAIYVQQGASNLHRDRSPRNRPLQQPRTEVPFCQLGGRWNVEKGRQLFERLQDGRPFDWYRRRSDGMRCVVLPEATVEIGSDDPSFDQDSRPQHTVQLDSFLIDAEPVSTTAYCRFLNTVGEVSHDCLMDWFLLTESDDRTEHALIEPTDSGWQPIHGCERSPMILVSWYGANAYSLWANRMDWQNYRGDVSFLPTEAQWEYAARGPMSREYPWGNEPASHELMQFGRHTPSEKYAATTLPMAAVNVKLGMSPFGLHHMAGNVWQWCRDWYDECFYSSPEAHARNSANQSETGARSERGGSWVGPAELCRSSHRRGRAPNARGRCLGFRCVSMVRSDTRNSLND